MSTPQSPKPKQTRKPKRDLPEFVVALREAEIPCAEREDEFVDYDWRNIPTQAQAVDLCARCPILMLCRQNARWRKPAWGVWGGEVWDSGKRAA